MAISAIQLRRDIQANFIGSTRRALLAEPLVLYDGTTGAALEVRFGTGATDSYFPNLPSFCKAGAQPVALLRGPTTEGGSSTSLTTSLGKLTISAASTNMLTVTADASGGGYTLQAPRPSLTDLGIGNVTNTRQLPYNFTGLTTKATPVAGDGLVIADSESDPVGLPKLVTWADLPVASFTPAAGQYRAGWIDDDGVEFPSGKVIMTKAERAALAKYIAVLGTPGTLTVTSGNNVASLPTVAATSYVAQYSALVITAPTTAETTLFDLALDKAWFSFTGASAFVDLLGSYFAIGGVNGATGAPSIPIKTYIDGVLQVPDSIGPTYSVEPRAFRFGLWLMRTRNQTTPNDPTTDVLMVQPVVSVTGGTGVGLDARATVAGSDGTDYLGNLTSAPALGGAFAYALGVPHDWATDVQAKMTLTPPAMHGVVPSGSITSTVWSTTSATGTWSSGSRTITLSAPASPALKVGQFVIGTGWPSTTQIESITNSTTVVMNGDPTAAGTGVALTFDGPRLEIKGRMLSARPNAGVIINGATGAAVAEKKYISVFVPVTGTVSDKVVAFAPFPLSQLKRVLARCEDAAGTATVSFRRGSNATLMKDTTAGTPLTAWNINNSGLVGAGDKYITFGPNENVQDGTRIKMSVTALSGTTEISLLFEYEEV